MQSPKTVGVVLLIVAAFCAFVAGERWQANAEQVRAAERFLRRSPFGMMDEDEKLEPAVPVATKYAIVLGILCAAGGLYLVLRKPEPAVTPRRDDR